MGNPAQPGPSGQIAKMEQAKPVRNLLGHIFPSLARPKTFKLCQAWPSPNYLQRKITRSTLKIYKMRANPKFPDMISLSL